MPRISVGVESWNRFRINELSIATSVAGSTHRFLCAGKMVEIRIPKRPRTLNQDAAFKEDEPIFCNSWWKSGRPVCFTVRSVDLIVELQRKVTIPGAALDRVNTALFKAGERERLDKLIAASEQVAAEAFDRWVRILRWKSQAYYIGQPEVTGPESGWGTYLQDSGSKKRFYTNTRIFTVSRAKTISKRVWRTTGDALKSGMEPPVWFDFLFDGEHRIAVGDLHGGIVSLAIACETLFRALLVRYLRTPIDDEVIGLMNQINIGRITDKWKRLRIARQWAGKVELGKIKRLFDVRNGIAHRGQARQLDRSECAELAKVTRAFVLFADRLQAR